MEKITRILFNWYASSENGEESSIRTVGTDYGKPSGICIEIREHYAAGEGDKWYYDVLYDSGMSERIFNPNMVYKEKINP
jgi:hypothetical protein